MTPTPVSAQRENNPSGRRVVVTGVGVTTPVGGDVASTWDALLAGRSGTRYLDEEWAEGLPVRIAAPVAVQPSEVLDRVEARRMDRTAQLAVVAARPAWADAGLAGKNADDAGLDPTRLGVVVGTGIGGLLTLMEQYDILREKGARRVSPLSVPMLMPNGPAAIVELEVGARAGTHTPVSACASGAEALAFGLQMIRTGRADIVIAGGTEACIHPITLAAFASMRALSSRHDEAGRASRPYDKGRDGFVMGEGAGILVLESSEHAAARGARVYAELAGQGMTSDAFHIAQPDPQGLGAGQAIREALVDADVEPNQVNHVSAHATSTPQGDVAEAAAIRSALGDATDNVVVSSAKGSFGHLLGAAGAVESVMTVLSLFKRLVPPTTNLDDLDDEVRLDVVTGVARELPAGDLVAVKNSFGFGGHNVALVFRSA